MESNAALVRMTRPDRSEQSLAPLIRELLAALVEEPEREGLMRTPERVSRALRFLTSGYELDLRKLVNGALFAVKYDEMVVVKDIEFFSLCEHHILPFFGRTRCVSAGFESDRVKQDSTNSQCARATLADSGAFTQEVAEAMQQIVSPLGVGVICEAKHFCMMMRG